MYMKIPGIKLHSFATTFIFLHTYANQNKVSILLPKVIIEKSCGGDSYGTEIEIWAGFGPVGIIEKKRFGLIMSNFLGLFFQVFIGKKF